MRTMDALTTERLRLRALNAGDAPRIAELANHFEVAKMVTGLPHPYGVSDAEDFIGRQKDFMGDGRAFVIDDPDGGAMGVVSLRKLPGAAFPTAGYWLGRPYWGRGYMTEALAAALRWARTGLGARAVASSHFVDNPASGWVLTKAGFLYTGEAEKQRSLGRGEEVLSRKMIWLA